MKFGFVFSLCLRIQPGTKVWPQKTTSLFFLVRLTSAVATTQTGWFRLNSHALVRKDVALEIDPIVHEDYNNPLSTSNDIALLKLAEPVDLNIYTPACLADLDADYTGQSGRVYGVFFFIGTLLIGLTFLITYFDTRLGISGLLPCLEPRCPAGGGGEGFFLEKPFNCQFWNTIQVSIISDEECDAQTSDSVTTADFNGECITQALEKSDCLQRIHHPVRLLRGHDLWGHDLRWSPWQGQLPGTVTNSQTSPFVVKISCKIISKKIRATAAGLSLWRMRKQTNTILSESSAGEWDALRWDFSCIMMEINRGSVIMIIRDALIQNWDFVSSLY